MLGESNWLSNYRGVSAVVCLKIPGQPRASRRPWYFPSVGERLHLYILFIFFKPCSIAAAAAAAAGRRYTRKSKKNSLNIPRHPNQKEEETPPLPLLLLRTHFENLCGYFQSGNQREKKKRDKRSSLPAPIVRTDAHSVVLVQQQHTQWSMDTNEHSSRRSTPMTLRRAREIVTYEYTPTTGASRRKSTNPPPHQSNNFMNRRGNGGGRGCNRLICIIKTWTHNTRIPVHTGRKQLAPTCQPVDLFTSAF